MKNDTVLIDQLAQQILHWRAGPDRFVTGNRSWLPKWRFNPLHRLDDAFLLLDQIKAVRYTISRTDGNFRVEVEHEGRIGRAAGDSKPRAITLALARCLGLEA